MSYILRVTKFAICIYSTAAVLKALVRVMGVSWKNRRVAKQPIALAKVPSARQVHLVDDRLDLTSFWVTPDAGSRPDPSGGVAFKWDYSIRRSLKSRPGWLGKALNPFEHKGKQKADGEYRIDLVVKPKKDIACKFARLLCDWLDDEGRIMDACEQESLEVDHILEWSSGAPPRNYCLSNLRPIDVGSHRQEQPLRGVKRKPATATRVRRRRAAKTR